MDKSNITGKQSIVEGQAEIRVSSEKVFYNPVQEFNRDLSIAVLSVFIDDYRKEQNEKAFKKSEKFKTEGINPQDNHLVCKMIFHFHIYYNLKKIFQIQYKKVFCL